MFFLLMTQRKQSVVRLERGGSWKLHLPSTLSMLVLIPASLLVMRSMCRAGAGLRREGWGAVILGTAIILGCTVWFTSNPLASLWEEDMAAGIVLLS